MNRRLIASCDRRWDTVFTQENFDRRNNKFYGRHCYFIYLGVDTIEEIRYSIPAIGVAQRLSSAFGNIRIEFDWKANALNYPPKKGEEAYEEPKVLATYKKEDLEEEVTPHGQSGGGCGS